MSQDGKGQVIPRDIESDQPPPGFDCSCGGWVYARNGASYRKCSRGTVHCMACQRPARRFRRGWTCSHEDTKAA